MSVAETIIMQLGGLNRLLAFVDANNFIEDKYDLTFKFKGSRIANKVNIHLNGRDLYDLKFYKDKKKVKEVNDIFCDQLVDTFEQTTQLYLRF